jgi:serine/threonine protein kinase
MDSPADANPTPEPSEICGYPIDHALTPGQSYLAVGPGGRGIVLKKLDEDCLTRGKLHPSIKERLSRVRELAHGGVANFSGVERGEDSAYLIWEYVPGETFDEYVAAPQRTPRDLLLIARELILGVDSLHMQGIVHGAICGGNIIIPGDGGIRMTHISPLLYTDVAVDVESVRWLLEHAVERRNEQESPLGKLLADAARDQMPLRTLGTRVAALIESREKPGETQTKRQERHIRRRTLLAAAMVALLGVAIAYGAWRVVQGGADLHPSLRWLPNSTAGK